MSAKIIISVHNSPKGFDIRMSKVKDLFANKSEKEYANNLWRCLYEYLNEMARKSRQESK
jgi:hypothetical protein